MQFFSMLTISSQRQRNYIAKTLQHTISFLDENLIGIMVYVTAPIRQGGSLNDNKAAKRTNR